MVICRITIQKGNLWLEVFDEVCRKGRPALSSDKSGQDLASTEANVTVIYGEHDQGAQIGSDSRQLKLGRLPYKAIALNGEGAPI
jgi:hypothetical protein